MPRFSANLGFLWTELSLPDAIRAAKKAGFDAVECHWPYDYEADDINAALSETGLPMLGLNTRRGDRDGDAGIAAVIDSQDRARTYIDEALDYGALIGAVAVHVMPGKTDRCEESQACFIDNLGYACERAASKSMTILIEPINQRDIPGYHLSHLQHALEIIEQVSADNLKIMFDCYHIQITHGDLITRLHNTLPHIGHIQFAAVPDRGEPNDGEINYRAVFEAIDKMDYKGFLGAEYRPRTSTDADLGWMKSLL